jgi:hypothetical protein
MEIDVKALELLPAKHEVAGLLPCLFTCLITCLITT